MPGWVLDVLLLVIVGGITYAVSSEGLWGSALVFVNVMFAGLIAFNFYEPLAYLISDNVNISFVESFADFVSLIVLFSVVFSILRVCTDFLGPTRIRFVGWLDQLGRIFFGLTTAWYVTGMLLCVVQTAPVHKQFVGYQWERHAFWGLGIDRFWLGYVQVTTGKIFDHNPRRVFDENSDFIRRYHDHRLFGSPDPTLPDS